MMDICAPPSDTEASVAYVFIKRRLPEVDSTDFRESVWTKRNTCIDSAACGRRHVVNDNCVQAAADQKSPEVK